MKKKCMFLFIVCCFFTGNISAQSFFEKALKKVDKVVNEVDKAVDKLDNTEQTSKQAETQKGVENQTVVVDTVEEKVQIPEKFENVIKGLQGNVKELTETNLWQGKTSKSVFRFNEKKQITYAEIVSYNNNVNIILSYEYTPFGRIAKRTYRKNQKSDNQNLLGAQNEIKGISFNEEPFYDPAISIYGIYDNQNEVYTYNNQGKLMKILTTYSDSYNNGTTEMFFNAKEKVIKRITKDASGVNEYIYNDKGDLISHKLDGKAVPQYDDEDFGDDLGETKEKHDTKGRLIETYNNMASKKYTYNLNNYLVSVKASDHWWGDESTTYSAYLYDVKKNWTKRTVKMIGGYYGKTGLTVTTTRNIIYY